MATHFFFMSTVYNWIRLGVHHCASNSSFNVPTHTPQSGYDGITEVAKSANIPKVAKKCKNCISARPTLPHTNPMESGPINTFSAQNRKKPKYS